MPRTRASDPVLATAAGHAALAGLAPLRVLLCAALLLACGETPAGPANVVLITLDTVRADRLGCYGYGGGTSPNLDALAARGVRFDDAIAQSTATTPSHASILTGLVPPRHGLHKLYGERLADSNETLAEILSRAGYATAAFVSAIPLRRAVGLDQGFETYDDSWDADGAEPARERPAFETNRRVEAWLESGPREPFFLWVHYFDPHHPYFPPEEYRRRQGVDVDSLVGLPESLDASHTRPGREPDPPPEPLLAQGMSQLYDAEVAYVDAAVGELLAALDDAGALDRSIVAVVADHGEQLGEHGYWFGHWDVLDETARVPMLLAHPDGRFAGRVVEASVGTIDLVPTLLAWLDLDGGGRSGAGFDGRDLTAIVESGRAEPRAQYTEQFEFFPVRSMRGGAWMLREQSDPAQRDAAASRRLLPRSAPRRPQGRVSDALASWLREQLDGVSRPANPHETVKMRLPDEVRAQLRALGYSNDSNDEADAVDAGAAPDPSDPR